MYNRRNITKRLERELKHNNRAIEERSKTITGFPFIEKIEVYSFGDTDKLYTEFVVHFNLSNPVLLKHFEEVLRNKLGCAIIG